MFVHNWGNCGQFCKLFCNFLNLDLFLGFSSFRWNHGQSWRRLHLDSWGGRFVWRRHLAFGRGQKCQGVQTKTDLRSTYPLQICPPNRLFNFVVDLLKQGNARMKKHPPKYYCSSDLVLVAVTGLFDVPGKNSSFSYPLCINLVVIVIVYSGCCRHILPFIWAIKLQPTFEQLIQWQQ